MRPVTSTRLGVDLVPVGCCVPPHCSLDGFRVRGVSLPSSGSLLFLTARKGVPRLHAGTTVTQSRSATVDAGIEVCPAEWMTVSAMGLSRLTTCEAFAPADILPDRHGFQMIGVDALGLTAQVVDDQTIGDGAMRQRIGDPMGICSFPVARDAGDAVPTDQRTHPSPTVIETCRPRPETSMPLLRSPRFQGRLGLHHEPPTRGVTGPGVVAPRPLHVTTEAP